MSCFANLSANRYTHQSPSVYLDDLLYTDCRFINCCNPITLQSKASALPPHVFIWYSLSSGSDTDNTVVLLPWLYSVNTHGGICITAWLYPQHACWEGRGAVYCRDMNVKWNGGTICCRGFYFFTGVFPTALNACCGVKKSVKSRTYVQ